MASSFTTNLQLENPNPGEQNNVWGTTENNGRTLTDSAVAGILTLGVGGSANVILTSVSGAPDQERNAHFIFTGVLTGNINILYPSGRSKVFSVANNTTGAFTLSIGANNGSGAPAGTVVTVPQGASVELVSDGTNVVPRTSNVNGPAVSTAGNIATYSDTTGRQLSDSGVGAANVVQGPASSVAGNLPSFSGVSGKLLQDSGVSAAGIAPPGMMVPFAGFTAPAGWLLCDGSAVSRTTFANLFAALSISTTGNFSSSSQVVTNIPNTAGMVAGMSISGPNVPTGATIQSVDSMTQIHMSANAVGTLPATGAALVVCPYGVGNGTTTFNVPDARGRVVAGVDGGAGRLGGNTSMGGFTGVAFLGAAAGEQAHAQTSSELATHTHGIADPGHAHTYAGWNFATSGPSNQPSMAFSAQLTSGSTDGAFTNISIQNAGSSNPANVTQPTLVANYIVKT